ncbi:Metallo-hydrolase/oxidoreductase [Chiua virens]|nr:Metallo-hydrolase/oxidoreductase [Chiua virens]
MCRYLDEHNTAQTQASITRTSASGAHPPAFKARRLTNSTFLITEWDDIWVEHPFIYAKIVPVARTILLLDTGCGGRTDNPDIALKDLRTFIETVPVDDNAGMPLNPDGKLSYVVVLSHCHYDHILGVGAFAVDSPVLCSGYDPAFVSPKNLPHHSLCDKLGVRIPSYRPDLVPHLHSISATRGNVRVPLGVTVLHTPGHTPDELALWDAKESMLYVGDTLYEDDPIIFPEEGSIPIWFSTIDKLLSFVRRQPNAGQVQINCGHATAMKPAIDVLEAAKSFMDDVVSEKEPLKGRYQREMFWWSSTSRQVADFR